MINTDYKLFKKNKNKNRWIYKGTTNQCHTKCVFPSSLDVHHSENRSTIEAMLRYIDTIMKLYIENEKDPLDFPLRKKALANFFYLFIAH